MVYRGYSVAQGKATMKYQAGLKSYNLRMPHELFERYKTAAERLGVSVRQLFLLGASEYIEKRITRQ